MIRNIGLSPKTSHVFVTHHTPEIIEVKNCVIVILDHAFRVSFDYYVLNSWSLWET